MPDTPSPSPPGAAAVQQIETRYPGAIAAIIGVLRTAAPLDSRDIDSILFFGAADREILRKILTVMVDAHILEHDARGYWLDGAYRRRDFARAYREAFLARRSETTKPR